MPSINEIGLIVRKRLKTYRQIKSGYITFTKGLFIYISVAQALIDELKIQKAF